MIIIDVRVLTSESIRHFFSQTNTKNLKSEMEQLGNECVIDLSLSGIMM